jgi:DNA-directed RNA polymerase specialized sigma24 family protein
LHKGTVLGTIKLLQKPVKAPDQDQLERIQLIEEMVMNYQQNMSDFNAQGLLSYFRPLLLKYTRIIKNGKVNWEDHSVKIFLYAFLGNVGKGKVGRQILYQDKLRIMKLIYGQTSWEDVYSELKVILFLLVSRYKPMDRSFCAYLAGSFPYEVARSVRRFTASQSTWHPRCDSTDEICIEELADDTVLDTFEAIEQENDFDFVDDYGYLTEAWIEKADMEIFARLTPIERKLIKDYYQERKNDLEISQDLGLHINTVNQKRNNAVKEVSKMLGVEPARSRNPQQSQRKGTQAKQTVAPVIQLVPKTVEENMIIKSLCDNCFHSSVCKYREWYTQRLSEIAKSPLMQGIDENRFTVSFTCANQLQTKVS